MGAPPPTGMLPPEGEGAPPFPFGGGGVWADKLIVITLIFIRMSRVKPNRPNGGEGRKLVIE